MTEATAVIDHEVSPTESMLIGKAVQAALTENRKRIGKEFGERLREIGGKEAIMPFVTDAWKRMIQLEEAAHHPREHLPKTPEEAQSIKVLWDISAPGTFFQKSKEDAYKDKTWAEWGDKRRWKYTDGLYRYLTRITGDKSIPHVLYNGRPDEDRDAIKAIDEGLLSIPSENVHIIDDNIKTTGDQVQSQKFKDALAGLGLQAGDTIGIVVSAPQAVRLMHMIEHSKPFPYGVKARIFPLPTPGTGLTEYHEQEIKGLVYYAFFSHPPLAAKTPYSYTF